MNIYTNKRTIGKYNSQDFIINHYYSTYKEHRSLGIFSLGELIIDKCLYEVIFLDIGPFCFFLNHASNFLGLYLQNGWYVCVISASWSFPHLMKLSLGHWKCKGSVIIYGESFLLPIIYFSENTKLDHKHGYLKNQSTKIPFSEDVVLLIYVRSKTRTAKVKLRGVIYKIHKTKC